MIPTLIGITLITFFLMKLAPGDPLQLKLMFAGENLSPDVLEELLKAEETPLDLPSWYLNFSDSITDLIHGEGFAQHCKVLKEKALEEKIEPKSCEDPAAYRALHWMGETSLHYFKWVNNLIHLDFGYSKQDKEAVSAKISRALPITLLINFLTLLVVYSVSVPLGIWSALNRESFVDKLVMVKLFVLYALPTFWVAYMLLIYYAGGDYFNIFPMVGYKSVYYDQLNIFQKVADVAWHLVLPVTAASLGSFAFLTRFARSNFMDVIGQDYIRTARAKGLKENIVIYKHGLRNALIPFVTLMGTLLPGLLGGSVVIEQIFTINGLGMVSFQAVLARDHNVIMAFAFIGAFLTLISLLLSDIMYTIVDPRIRLK